MADISCFRIRLPLNLSIKSAIILAQQPAELGSPPDMAASYTPSLFALHPFCCRGVSPEAEKCKAKFGKRGARIDLNPSLCRVSPHK